uniref:Uncharacterized protein n=1 Tax=Leersia perrieri TaxID=77586 RepID=A0A0D9V8V7_9ORYZ
MPSIERAPAPALSTFSIHRHEADKEKELSGLRVNARPAVVVVVSRDHRSARAALVIDELKATNKMPLRRMEEGRGGYPLLEPRQEHDDGRRPTPFLTNFTRGVIIGIEIMLMAILIIGDFPGIFVRLPPDY